MFATSRAKLTGRFAPIFCGYTFNAVTGLLPVIEGIIRKVANSQGRDVGPGTKGLNDELQAFVERELQSAHCYGERLVMLEAFRDFVRDRLLESTKRFVGLMNSTGTEYYTGFSMISDRLSIFCA
jgi:hypothetical protein